MVWLRNLGCEYRVKDWAGPKISHHVRRRLVRAESVATQRRVLQKIISSATPRLQAPGAIIHLVIHVQRRLHFIIIQHFSIARYFARDSSAHSYRSLIFPRDPLHAIPDDTKLPFRSVGPDQEPHALLPIPSNCDRSQLPSDAAAAGHVGAAVLLAAAAPDE